MSRYSVSGLLGLLLVGLALIACMGPQAPGGLRPAYDRILLAGDVQVAETQAALRAYQRRYGLPVTGLLDDPTRRELLPGLVQPGITR